MRIVHSLIFALAVVLGLSTKTVMADDQPFTFGVDLSFTNQMEDCGATFGIKKKTQSTFQLFHNAGANLVRVRLFHTPDWTEYSTLADVKKTIRRAKASGLDVLLDFHYSDNWAHPGQQVIPKAWAHLSDTDVLAKALYDYTYSVLMELDAEGLIPEMVQVGNETNTEILLGDKESASDEIVTASQDGTGINWPRNAHLLNAGIKAVRDVAKQTNKAPKIMLHIAQPENVESWFELATANGIIDYDIIGISYYPKWSEFSIQELAATINRVRHRFSKEVMVAEVSYAWTDNWRDTTTNILGSTSAIKGYPVSKKGQKKYLIDLTQAIITAGGSGIIYWGTEYVSTSCKNRWGVGSSWENATLFDFSKPHRLLPSIAYMTHDYETPQPVTFRVVLENSELQDQTLYLWGDFLGTNEFVLSLPGNNGVYEYNTKVMTGDSFRYQIFADPQLTRPLIVVKDRDQSAGFPQVSVGKSPLLIKHTIQ